MIEERLITSGHAKILVGLENAEFIANKVIEKKLSVRQTESLVKIFKKKNKKNNIKLKDVNISELRKKYIRKNWS
jgi:ParB family chromosome partitioning protein